MRCVCRTTCQVRVGNSIIFYERGQVGDFDVCPPHFEPMEDSTKYVLDLGTAGRDEMLAADITAEELQKYLLGTYDKTSRSTNKERLVDAILDARMRSLSDINPNDLASTQV